MFENRVLRRIFGPKRDEVVGGWRRLHNEELRNFYVSLNIIRVIKSGRVTWAGHVACMGEMKNAYKILVGTSDGKRLLGRPRRRWQKSLDLRDIGWGVWTGFIWLRIETSGRLL
jgi:hypothetical protein